MNLIRTIVGNLQASSRSEATFKRLLKQKRICLYAGDLPEGAHYDNYIGLSPSQSNQRHILHDVTTSLPLPDACVDIYQSEDVFEHIEPTLLPALVDDIYRVLKPGGIFRLSVPDYRCDVFHARTVKNERDELIFDPGGGGSYEDGKVVGGGHMWFPKYESVKAVIDATRFTDVTFYHYYDPDGRPVTKPIDYSFGYVMRTPDHDIRVRDPYRPMSIVLDCRK